MKAVILAAGVGSRIRPLTNTIPKSLLPIGSSTILGLMLSNLAGVTNEIAIVTGYRENQIREYCKSNFSQFRFTFICNKIYEKTNTGYSLLLSRGFIGTDSFLKFDADVVFDKKILDKIIADKRENCLCIDKNINLAAEEVKVITDRDGRVLQIGKKIRPADAKGESIGIEKIGHSASRELFKNLKRLMANEDNYNEYYDDQYGLLTQSGIPFYATDITGLKWVEIDTHEDYQQAIKNFT